MTAGGDGAAAAAAGGGGAAIAFPFLKENHKPAARAIVLLPALFGSFKRKVTAELDGITALVTTLIEAASSGADEEQCRAASIAAAALVNKCGVDDLAGCVRYPRRVRCGIGVVYSGAAWCGVVWCSVVWCCVVWHNDLTM